MGTCKRRDHRNYSFVIQRGHTLLPQLPSHHSQASSCFCTWVYQMTRPRLYQVGCEKAGTIPLRALICLFLQLCCLECVQRTENQSWSHRYFESVIIPLKDHIYATVLDVSCLFSVISCLHFFFLFCRNWNCCHSPPSWNLLPPQHFSSCPTTLNLPVLSHLTITIGILAWDWYPYFHPWLRSSAPESHFQQGISI